MQKIGLYYKEILKTKLEIIKDILQPNPIPDTKWAVFKIENLIKEIDEDMLKSIIYISIQPQDESKDYSVVRYMLPNSSRVKLYHGIKNITSEQVIEAFSSKPREWNKYYLFKFVSNTELDDIYKNLVGFKE